MGNVLHGNGYAFSAKAAPYVIVHFCVFPSSARMTKTSYSPVLHVSADDLRVACEYVEGNPGLGCVKSSYEVKESFSQPYPLEVWEHNESGDAVVSCFHVDVDYCDESYRFVLVNGAVASCIRNQGAV